jgi:hypothetical protein
MASNKFRRGLNCATSQQILSKDIQCKPALRQIKTGNMEMKITKERKVVTVQGKISRNATAKSVKSHEIGYIARRLGRIQHSRKKSYTPNI